MNTPKMIAIRKHLVYSVTLILIYVLQTTPLFLEINGVKPMLVFGAAIAIAMVEGEFIGGIYGAFAGMLCDTAGFAVFGFNAICMLISCVVISLLIHYLIQMSFVTHLIYTFIMTIIILSLQFIFIYGIWRLDDIERLYIKKVLLVSVYTGAISPFIYYLYKKLNGYFAGLSG